jgi:hypothetical protein
MEWKVVCLAGVTVDEMVPVSISRHEFFFVFQTEAFSRIFGNCCSAELCEVKTL